MRRAVAAVVAVVLAVALTSFAWPSAALAYSSTDTSGQYPWPHNGCSSPFGDAPSGVSFTYACNHHDGCYNKHWAGKATCDLWFKNDMENACNSSRRSATVIADCRRWASRYYKAVQIFGGPYYLCRCDPNLPPVTYFA